MLCVAQCLLGTLYIYGASDGARDGSNLLDFVVEIREAGLATSSDWQLPSNRKVGCSPDKARTIVIVRCVCAKLLVVERSNFCSQSQIVAAART